MHWLQKCLFYQCIIIGYTCYADREGDPCRPTKDIAEGTCTLATRCQIAIDHIKNTHSHPFSRCGFMGDTEIVCCPNSDPSNKFGPNRNPNSSQPKRGLNRIADRECENIIEKSIPPLGLHIIGGERASVGDFPHMVAVGFDRGKGYEFDCGGTLISDRYVLTAAHCVVTRDSIPPSVIRAGVVELGERRWNKDTDARVDSISVHPRYTTREIYHDLALIRLETPISIYSNPNAACLYTGATDPEQELTITGWGVIDTTTNKRTEYLLKANVTLVDRDACAEHYRDQRKLPRRVTNEQLCAGDSEGLRDACQGDSGGPLQGLIGKDGIYRIVGITSYGRGCGSKVPGIYTRITNYLDWIESVVWPGD